MVTSKSCVPVFMNLPSCVRYNEIVLRLTLRNSDEQVHYKFMTFCIRNMLHQLSFHWTNRYIATIYLHRWNWPNIYFFLIHWMFTNIFLLSEHYRGMTLFARNNWWIVTLSLTVWWKNWSPMFRSFHTWAIHIIGFVCKEIIGYTLFIK